MIVINGSGIIDGLVLIPESILFNKNTVDANITITATNNGLSAGPITIGNGIEVTVETGAVWTIV